MNPRNLLASGIVALTLSLGFGACGDDDDASSAENGTAAADNPADPRYGNDADGTIADGPVDDGDDTVIVTLADYEFRDLPDSIPAGTQLSVVNVADEELHELVAFRLPDDEDRSVEDLINLPPDEFGAVMGSLGEPETVLLAAPGGPQIHAVGDGTLDEAGRYAIFCMIPIGVEPAVYLQAAEEGGEGPPQIEGAGPPHITAGMYAEITVE